MLMLPRGQSAVAFAASLVAASHQPLLEAVVVLHQLSLEPDAYAEPLLNLGRQDISIISTFNSCLRSVQLSPSKTVRRTTKHEKDLLTALLPSAHMIQSPPDHVGETVCKRS